MKQTKEQEPKKFGWGSFFKYIFTGDLSQYKKTNNEETAKDQTEQNIHEDESGDFLVLKDNELEFSEEE
jgi:hypothetical protein